MERTAAGWHQRQWPGGRLFQHARRHRLHAFLCTDDADGMRPGNAGWNLQLAVWHQRQWSGGRLSYTGDTATIAFLYTSGSGMVDLNSLIDPLSGWEL